MSDTAKMSAIQAVRTYIDAPTMGPVSRREAMEAAREVHESLDALSLAYQRLTERSSEASELLEYERHARRLAETKRDELIAARIAYASEFPLDENGEPDVGNIHANIRAMKAELNIVRAANESLRRARDAYRLAKEENDERFMFERDIAREHVAKVERALEEVRRLASDLIADGVDVNVRRCGQVFLDAIAGAPATRVEE